MQAGPIRILLVEDTAEDALLLEALLRDARGFSFGLTRAESLAEAEAALASTRFDAALLDLTLPDARGLETVRRTLAADASVPVVVLTGTSDAEVALRAMQEGVQDYLVKGELSAALLVRTIRYAIERKRREIEFREEAEARRRSEEALQRSEAYFRALTENATDVIVILDAEGTIRYQSPSVASVLGYGPGEMLGERAVSFAHPEDAEGSRRRLAEVASEAGCSIEYEVRLRAADGGWRVMEGVAVNLLDEPAVRGIVSTARDVTENREARAQLDAYTQELERSNQALQDFAYVASHDLQEPLRKIRTFGDRLQSRFGSQLGEQGSDYVARMQNAAERMQTLIEGLLTYSRVATRGQPFERVDLDEVVAGVLSDLSTRLEQSGGEVEVDPLPTVNADPVQMRQLLQNLIVNALKFHRPGVPPRVRVRARTAGTTLELAIEDRGIGFDPRFAQRIFAPFHRLHGRGEYEGTGMGLAICQRIAKRHGGEIEARGAPDEGAVFTVRLPMHPSPGESQ